MNNNVDNPQNPNIIQNPKTLASNLQDLKQRLINNPDLLVSPDFGPVKEEIGQIHKIIDDYELQHNTNREAQQWVKEISTHGASRLMIKTNSTYDFSNPSIPVNPNEYRGTGFRHIYTGNEQLINNDELQFGLSITDELTSNATLNYNTSLSHENYLISYQKPNSNNVFITYISWQHPASPGVDMRNAARGIGNEVRYTINLPKNLALQLLDGIDKNPNLIESIFTNTYPQLFSETCDENHLTRIKTDILNIFHKDGATDDHHITFDPPKYPYEINKPRIYLKQVKFNSHVGEADLK